MAVSPKKRIGIIGGSGLYEIEGLRNLDRIRVATPFGDPSDTLDIGEIEGKEVVFLPRHGRRHRILPSEINTPANIWALKSLGVAWIISVSAVGSYKKEIKPLDIVLVDRTNPFGNRHLLPRGVLREPVKNIRRASFIFITKSNGDGAEELKRQLRELNPNAEISECRHSPKHLRNVYTGERKELDFLKGKDVAAVSAIAVPKGFEDELGRLGARVLYHKRYADHHRYSQQEILNIINKSMDRGASAIITTEKDAVRFPMIERRDLPIYFMRVEIEMLSGAEDFNELISRICFK